MITIVLDFKRVRVYRTSKGVYMAAGPGGKCPTVSRDWVVALVTEILNGNFPPEEYWFYDEEVDALLKEV